MAGQQGGGAAGRLDTEQDGIALSAGGAAPLPHGPADPLAPCVHCGFCLPACPTYLATGDEADSPRGRIVLMRALERGEIARTTRRWCSISTPASAAAAASRSVPRAWPTAAGWSWRGSGSSASAVCRRSPARCSASSGTSGSGGRCSPRPALFARQDCRGASPAAGGWGSGWGCWRRRAGSRAAGQAGSRATRRYPETKLAALPPAGPSARPTVALFRGCVMDTLFRHVNDATRRTLEYNGYDVVEVEGQACCGALHEHAGDREAAAALARRNVAALRGRRTSSSPTAPGAARCSRTTATCWAPRRPATSAARVRDVTELLAAAGPRPGAPLDARRRLRRALSPPARPAGPGGAARGAARGPRPAAPAAARLRPLLRQRGDLLGADARDGPRGARRQDRRPSPPPTRGPRSWPRETRAA